MSKPIAVAGAGIAQRSLTVAEKLHLIQVAVFSVDDTITAAEAISLIASVFKEDPVHRIDRTRLAELLAFVTPPKKGRRR